ncbi:hypothetical protein ACTXT7_007583 [Hymenolepis weldensis]
MLWTRRDQNGTKPISFIPNNSQAVKSDVRTRFEEDKGVEKQNNLQCIISSFTIKKTVVYLLERVEIHSLTSDYSKIQVACIDSWVFG